MFYFTRKHRSLFGVEKRIFQIENLLEILRTEYVPFKTYIFVVFISLKIQSVRQKFLVYLSPVVIKSI